VAGIGGRLTALALAGCLLAIAACSSSNRADDSTVVDGHSAHFTGPLDHVVIYGPQQMKFQQPPANASMPMDWKSAYRTCFSGATRCAATGDATIALAVATGPPGYPRRSDPTDMTGNAYNHTLVYVITWDPAPCVTGQVSASLCHVVDLVDARSRRPAFAIEIADSQPIIAS